jgi:hypothetical protein
MWGCNFKSVVVLFKKSPNSFQVGVLQDFFSLSIACMWVMVVFFPILFFNLLFGQWFFTFNHIYVDYNCMLKLILNFIFLQSLVKNGYMFLFLLLCVV